MFGCSILANQRLLPGSSLIADYLVTPYPLHGKSIVRPLSLRCKFGVSSVGNRSQSELNPKDEGGHISKQISLHQEIVSNYRHGEHEEKHKDIWLIPYFVAAL